MLNKSVLVVFCLILKNEPEADFKLNCYVVNDKGPL